MTAINYVFKRGSIYWWRRRLPLGSGVRGSLLVEMSLRVKSQADARLLASEITLCSERIYQRLRDNMISAEDAKKILIKIGKKHTAKLDVIAASHLASGGDPEEGRFDDIVNGWTNRMFASQGQFPNMTPNVISEMRAAGLDDPTIDAIERNIAIFHSYRIYNSSTSKVRALLDELDIPDTEVNLKQAQQLYHRGLSAALLDVKRRWSGIREDDNALLQAALMEEAEQVSPHSKAVALNKPASTNPLQSDDIDDELSDEEDDDFDQEVSDVEYSDQPEKVGDIVALVDRVSAEKVISKEWTTKTQSQHISVAKLFVKVVGHSDPGRMRQQHISTFRSVLFRLPKTHGKSPLDATRTIDEILQRAETLPREQVGLSQETINRYMTQINNIVSICKHAGYPFEDYEGVVGLRIKKKGNERTERGKFLTEEIGDIFSLPIWYGCRAEKKRLIEGDEIYHDSQYWLPILGIYTGARREEICGLLTSEIHIDGVMPCISIEDNFVRTLKTPQSKRRIPLHPELIRLGFLDYVAALDAANHILLFPELRAVAAATPMGDVYSDEWTKVRDLAVPTAKELKKTFHSLRHWCNDEMKQQGIPVEIRKDIIGHKGDGVNEARYSNPASLRLMAEALSTLPQPTAHLVPYPINLLSSVITHKSAPTKRAKAVQ